MTIATFMILDQLQIAQNIVVITYAGLIGAIALGSALAFGLGGRDVAREMLQGAYEKGQQNKEQFKRDLDQGISRARDEVQTARDELSSSDDASSVDTQRQPVVASRDRDGSTPHDPMAPGLPGETAFEPAHEPAERRNLT
jgi:hypothetical protein